MHDNKSNDADDIRRKAQAKLQSSCKRPSDYEEIAEMFNKAALLYKRDRKYVDAAECWENASQLYHASKNNYESASCLKEAAKCMKNAERFTEYVNYLKQSATMMTDEGKFSLAATAYKEAAETLFQNADYDKALEMYLLAVDIMSIDDDSKVTYMTTLSKLAECYALLEDYENAWKSFEQAGESQLKKNSVIGNHTAIDCFFKAGLCALCYDLVTAKRSIEKYDTELSSFSSSRQGRFLHEIATAYEGMNEAQFMEAVKMNEATIDNLQTKLLLKIKKEIQAEDALI